MKAKSNKKVRALLLFSGGLDSLLAAKVLKEQGIEVTALTFVSYFFNAQQAKKSAKENGLNLILKDFSKKHFQIVKNPHFGYGAGINPCLDCHLLMLKEAKKIAEKEKFDILATGEVLGQRPLSQNTRALRIIEQEAGLVGKILRPLSAKVLPETEMEKKGLVNREKLLGFQGRSRKSQLALAQKYGLKNYPTPAGGCILTDKEYAKKLRELLKNVKKPKPSDLELLRIGRHFWAEKTHFILGRNHEENLKLKKLAESGDILMEPKDIPGPTALIRGKKDRKVPEEAKKLLLKYTKKAPKNIKTELIPI